MNLFSGTAVGAGPVIGGAWLSIASCRERSQRGIRAGFDV
jgi:hypothetical protein